MTTRNERTQGDQDLKNGARGGVDDRGRDGARRPEGEPRKGELVGASKESKEPREHKEGDRGRQADRQAKPVRPPLKSVEELAHDLARADEEGMTAAPEVP